jgi:hypothetical protein
MELLRFTILTALCPCFMVLLYDGWAAILSAQDTGAYAHAVSLFVIYLFAAMVTNLILLALGCEIFLIVTHVVAGVQRLQEVRRNGERLLKEQIDPEALAQLTHEASRDPALACLDGLSYRYGMPALRRHPPNADPQAQEWRVIGPIGAALCKPLDYAAHDAAVAAFDRARRAGLAGHLQITPEAGCLGLAPEAGELAVLPDMTEPT